MPTAVAQVRLDDAALRELLGGPNGAVAKAVGRVAVAVQSEAKRLCPVDTGRLRSSITSKVVQEGGGPVGIVGTNVKYALWVHNGTGLYGPHHHPIVPVHARVLRWPVRGGSRGGFAYARSVRGTRGRPFLRDALHSVRI